jgi:PIN domain nuclease of toxin-antitoxin system
MSPVVLDTSAILALLQQEPGAGLVLGLTGDALISAVNAAEVLTKLVRDGIDLADARSDLEGCVQAIVDFDAEQGATAAGLIRHTQPLGLSLGDRACLALGLRMGCPVYTADRVWAQLQVGVDVRLIR